MNSFSIWEKIEKGVFVVAEIGKNFIQTEENQPVTVYLDNAKKLVLAAKEAGADAVKFQTHNVDDEQANIEVMSPHFKLLDRYRWVRRNTKATPLAEFWKPLKRACDELGIVFFSTPMSRGAALKLAEVNPPLWKVGSGDLLDFALLDFLRQSGKPIILSSGMSTFSEIDAAIAFLREKTDKIILLHCVSRYPCPPEALNLATVDFLRERYKIPIGFSDHSLSVDSSVSAVAMGARIIEKHFSFSRDLWGSDHKVSLCPREFKDLIAGIHRVFLDPLYRELVLNSAFTASVRGEKAKILQEDEAVFRSFFRKTLVAANDLPAGTRLAPELLYAMRPQGFLDGLSSEKYADVVGKTLSKPLKKHEPITGECILKNADIV